MMPSLGDTEGMVKILAAKNDAKNKDRILGAHIMGSVCQIVCSLRPRSKLCSGRWGTNC